MALLKVGESNRFSASRMSGSSGASVASLAGLALHTAHRFEHPGRAGAYEEGVVVDVQHPKTRFSPADRRLRPCTVDAGDQSSAYAGLQDRLDQAPVLRGARGRVGLHAMGDGQVIGADVHPVHAWHREDLIEGRHPLDGLDHDHAHDRAVGAFRPEAVHLERGPGRTPGAVALGRIPACADSPARLFFRVDHRHDHALRAGVEGLHDVGRLIPGHPHEGRRPGGGEGLEHGQHLVVTDHAVLRVDADPVIAGAAHQLGRERAGDDAPAADRRLATVPELAERHRLSRAPNLTPLTTLEGSSPSSTRVRLSRTTSNARASDSDVKPPTWGEKNTLSIRRSGLSAGVGSCSKTSSAAPPRWPDSRAAMRAFSSTTGPREALTSSAPFRIRISAPASIMWWVSLSSGTCTVTTSAR